MCEFFSFCTSPVKHGGKRFYFTWKQRTSLGLDDYDTHSGICRYYRLDEDETNKYEYNPLTKVFHVDQINSEVDDRVQVEEWARGLKNWKRIVKPLIIKPIVNPFDIEAPEIGEEQIELLKRWASVGASVMASVRASVWASVRASVRASVMASVRASVWASVRASVWDSVWDSVYRDSVGDSIYVYISSFFDIEYDYDYSPALKLWKQGFVSSYTGTTWRLHVGENAEIVYEMECE